MLGWVSVDVQECFQEIVLGKDFKIVVAPAPELTLTVILPVESSGDFSVHIFEEFVGVALRSSNQKVVVVPKETIGINLDLKDFLISGDDAAD